MLISTNLSNAMKVYIKWRVVAGTVCTLVLFLITYRTFFYYSSCDEEYQDSAAAALLNDYCNPPHLPATGLEGSVPVTSEKVKDFTLVSLHIVIRHGDRTAIHSLPNAWMQSVDCQIKPDLVNSVTGMNDFYHAMSNLSKHVHVIKTPYENYTLFPDSAICERSALTPLGVAQHVRNGRFLQEKYSRHHLLDVASIYNQILVRGTKYIRTFHSAVAFLHGFIPGLDVKMLNFEMADNNTMCTEKTNYQCWCPAVEDFLSVFSCTFRQELSKMRKNHEDEDLYNRINAIYQQLAEKLNVPIEELPKLSHMFDAGITHFCHNKRLPTGQRGCLESHMIRSMYDAVNAVGRKALEDGDYSRLAKLKMQPLMYEVAHRMEVQGRGQTQVKLVLYSGHDSTVDPLICALGVASGIWPKYASRLVFELYTQSGQHFLRLLYDGVVVTGDLTFCKGRMTNPELGLCKLDYFLDFVNQESLASIHEKDYLLACQKLIII